MATMSPVPELLVKSAESATYLKAGRDTYARDDLLQGPLPSDRDDYAIAVFTYNPIVIPDDFVIDSIRVYFYANHWYYHRGGTAVVNAHCYEELPTFPSLALTPMLKMHNWQSSIAKWIEVPESFFAGFASGMYKGFALGSPSRKGGMEEYGRFASKSQIKIKLKVANKMANPFKPGGFVKPTTQIHAALEDKVEIPWAVLIQLLRTAGGSVTLDAFDLDSFVGTRPEVKIEKKNDPWRISYSLEEDV